MNLTFRLCLSIGLVLVSSVAAMAAPTTSDGSENEAASANHPTRSSAGNPKGMPEGESRTMQLLLEMQSTRAPLEGGERARAAAPAPAAAQAMAPKLAAASPEHSSTHNPFSRALEMSRPAATRELRSPSVATAFAGESGARPVSTPEAAALRGERYGEAASPEANRALRDKIGVQVPLPVALMNYIRENRNTVLAISLVSLVLAAGVGARASQRRR